MQKKRKNNCLTDIVARRASRRRAVISYKKILTIFKINFVPIIVKIKMRRIKIKVYFVQKYLFWRKIIKLIKEIFWVKKLGVKMYWVSVF